MARKRLGPSSSTLNAAHALKRLQEGNRRFVQTIQGSEALTLQLDRRNLSSAQKPFAIILCCSDSRAPVELIFNQGLGDLFVVRVAGNIIAPSLVGSVEFAAASFGSELVVVMGHTGCGAIAATLDAAKQKRRAASENIQDIIQRIFPHIESLLTKRLTPRQLTQAATRANIKASVSELKHGSRILEDLVKLGKLNIIGAEYNLSTGEVDFFDSV